MTGQPEAPHLLALEAREAALKERIQVLEDALRPFAASPYASDMVKVPGSNPNEIFICEGVSLADMHAARAALQPKAVT